MDFVWLERVCEAHLVAEMGPYLSVSPRHDSVVVPGVPFGRDVSFRLDLRSSANDKGIVQDVEIDRTVQLPNPFGVAIDGAKGDLGWESRVSRRQRDKWGKKGLNTTCGLHRHVGEGQVGHVETTGGVAAQMN